MVVIITYCCYFQNPRNLQNYFITRYDLVLYFLGEMNSYLKVWSEHIRQEAKRSQKQLTEDSNMNKINLSSKTCIKRWENNSSELEKCVKTAKWNACGTKCISPCPMSQGPPPDHPYLGSERLGYHSSLVSESLAIWRYWCSEEFPESFDRSISKLKLLWE